jgi:hypothetical protein
MELPHPSNPDRPLSNWFESLGNVSPSGTDALNTRRKVLQPGGSQPFRSAKLGFEFFHAGMRKNGKKLLTKNAFTL